MLSKQDHQVRSPSPQLVTPSGTPPAFTQFPPSFNEGRLAQLLSNFDSGTHSIDMGNRESTEKRMSFGELFGTPSSSRRGSFLSSLSLTRPGFGLSSGNSTPASQTPISGSQPKESLLASLHMTSTSAISDEPDGEMPASKSLSQLPRIPGSGEKQQQQQEPQILDAKPGQMQRSSSSPQSHVTVTGFSVGQVQGQIKVPVQKDMERRHFDPSKEPRLLGII